MSQLITRQILEAWRPPKEQTPSQWATDNIVLPRGESSRPGPLDHRNAPYLAGLIDLAVIPGVWQLNVIKGGQIGVSAAVRWLIGYLACTRPDPIGIALPDREKGEKIISNRLIPMFQRTRALRRLMSGRTHDLKKQQLKLANGFLLHLMWSGSPSSTASDPMRVVICDEVDKFSAWDNDEAHAVYRTQTRLTTYEERGLQINISTPTTSLRSMINQLHTESDLHLQYLVPCPKCGTRQALLIDRLKWDAGQGDRSTRAAALVSGERPTWFECAGCSHGLTDAERRRAVIAGAWGTCDEHGVADGKITDAAALEELPTRTRIGAHIGGLACMWKRQEEIAARWLMAKGDFQKMFSFRTEEVGAVFEQQVAKVDTGLIGQRVAEAELDAAVLPWWCDRIIAAIDTQRDHFWIVIRAWGAGMRSQRIWHGKADTFDDLNNLLSTLWPVEGNRYPAQRCYGAVIDSGAGEGGEDDEEGRTMQVYRWAMAQGPRVMCIKGDSSPRLGVWLRKGTGIYTSANIKQKVDLWLIDSQHYEDELASMIQRQQIDDTDEPDEHGELVPRWQWRLNNDDDETYKRHMANRHKVAAKVGKAMVQRWQGVGSAARFDLRMCEVYQVAGANLCGVPVLEGMTLEAWKLARDQELSQQRVLREQHADQGADYSLDGNRPYLASER